ncbi:MAG: thioredoxin fold domain-containing protein [Desulfuromonadales bacterium]|nr:thioredoxin fold domain-containing protein [Desulfuromonadales bacterium]
MASRVGNCGRVIKGCFICAALLLVIVLGCAAPLVAGEIDFSKAVRIGSGPKTVVEFTDPDCPFCRQASHYLDNRADVTRYVFFYPLARHPKAREKVQYILSQSDRARAYHEVMAGKMDSATLFTTTAKGIRLQQEQFEIATRAKVDSTPSFMIFGRVFSGFDVKKFDELLGK